MGFFCCLCMVGFVCLCFKGGLLIFCCGVVFLVWLLSPFKIPEGSKQKMTLKVTEAEGQQRMHREKGRGSFHPPANTFSILQQISLLFSKEFLYLSFIRAFHSYQKPSLLPRLWSNPGIIRHDLFNTLCACWWQTCQPGSLSAHTLHLCGHCSSSCPSAKAALAQVWLSL